MTGILAAVVLAACASETTNPAPAGSVGLPVVQAGDTVDLRPGQVVEIGGGGLQLAFRTVEKDSRCPINALCVWSGNASVVLEARLGQSAWKRMVVNSYSEPRSADYGQYRFHLVHVTPAPHTDTVIEPAEYRVRIAVARR